MAGGVEALRRRLEQLLREIGIQFEIDHDGDLVVPVGNAVTYLRVFEAGGRAMVRVWSITNVGLEPSDELTRYLVTENTGLALGGFAFDGSGRVAYSHTLLGEFLQRAELEVALAVVASTADRYNDEIKSRFGGKLFGEP